MFSFLSLNISENPTEVEKLLYQTTIMPSTIDFFKVNQDIQSFLCLLLQTFESKFDKTMNIERKDVLNLLKTMCKVHVRLNEENDTNKYKSIIEIINENSKLLYMFLISDEKTLKKAFEPIPRKFKDELLTTFEEIRNICNELSTDLRNIASGKLRTAMEIDLGFWKRIVEMALVGIKINEEKIMMKSDDKKSISKNLSTLRSTKTYVGFLRPFQSMRTIPSILSANVLYECSNSSNHISLRAIDEQLDTWIKYLSENEVNDNLKMNYTRDENMGTKYNEFITSVQHEVDVIREFCIKAVVERFIDKTVALRGLEKWEMMLTSIDLNADINTKISTIIENITLSDFPEDAKKFLSDLMPEYFGNQKFITPAKVSKLLLDFVNFDEDNKNDNENEKEFRLVTFFRCLGPGIQKFFQHIASSIENPDIRQAAERLKSDVECYTPHHELFEIAKQELTRHNNQQFSGNLLKLLDDGKDFGEKYKANASIGQVYVLGKYVAKMIKPNVIQILKDEINLMKEIAKRTNFLSFIQDHLNSLEEELDLSKEKSNLDRLSKSYKRTLGDEGKIRVAKSYYGINSSLLLITRKAKGEVLRNFDPVIENPELKKTFLLQKHRALQNIYAIWLTTALFGNGHFHADLHDGNIFLDFPSASNDEPSYKKFTATLIDFGSCSHFDRSHQVAMIRLSIGLYLLDEEAITSALDTLYPRPSDIDRIYEAHFHYKVRRSVTEWSKNVPRKELMHKVFELLKSLDAGKMSGSFFQFIRGKDLLEIQLEKSSKEASDFINKHNLKASGSSWSILSLFSRQNSLPEGDEVFAYVLISQLQFWLELIKILQKKCFKSIYAFVLEHFKAIFVSVALIVTLMFLPYNTLSHNISQNSSMLTIVDDILLQGTVVFASYIDMVGGCTYA